jgi:hypothetical protein
MYSRKPGPNDVPIFRADNPPLGWPKEEGNQMLRPHLDRMREEQIRRIQNHNQEKQRQRAERHSIGPCPHCADPNTEAIRRIGSAFNDRRGDGG